MRYRDHGGLIGGADGVGIFHFGMMRRVAIVDVSGHEILAWASASSIQAKFRYANPIAIGIASPRSWVRFVCGLEAMR